VKVSTIDGGFRGLKGSIGSQQQLAAVEDFQNRLIDFDRTSNLIIDRLREASLPEAEAVEIERARQELRSAIDQHTLASSNVNTSEALMAWRTEAGRLVGLANQFVRATSQSLRAETSTRPWKVVIALVLGTAIVSAAAWGLAKIQ
jgi:flagellar basal body rod protein FlgG